MNGSLIDQIDQLPNMGIPGIPTSSIDKRLTSIRWWVDNGEPTMSTASFSHLEAMLPESESTCQTAQSRNLVLISLEIHVHLVLLFIIHFVLPCTVFFPRSPRSVQVHPRHFVNESEKGYKPFPKVLQHAENQRLA